MQMYKSKLHDISKLINDMLSLK